MIYFYSFGFEHVPIEIEKFIEHKNIKTNIFRIQSNNSIMSAYFYIWVNDFIFTGKTLIDYTSLFYLYDLKKKTGGIILKYFKDETNVTDQTKFRLNEISKIENYFNQEVKEKKLNSKKLSKYVAAFDYIDKI